jgi:hypothetical protein
MMPKDYNDDDLEVNQTSIWVETERHAPSATATPATKTERAELQQQQLQDEEHSSSQAATDALAEAKPREQRDHTQTSTSAIFDIANTVAANKGHSASNPKDAPEEQMMNNNHKLSFPSKLHMLLDEAQRMGYQDIVSWDADGDSFRVHKPIEFCESILVRYFRQSKYESFTRQCE